MAKIKAPNKDYTGISAGVTFVKGEAETDDKWLIGWFENKGYKVEDSAEKEVEKKAEESQKASEEEPKEEKPKKENKKKASSK